MKKLIILCAALMMISSIPAAMAQITVDGIMGTGEWDGNWSFGQTNNATAAAEYDIYNTGDRLEIRQGAFGHDTSIWYAEDPKNDSYSSPGVFDQTMAQLGESSGSDLKRIYGHYNQSTDTYYGLSTVYGIPGDLDGNGDIATNCSNFGDCLGDLDGPVDSGIGPYELWRIRISQQGASTVEIHVQDNNWSIVAGPLDYNDVLAKMDPTEGGVYEIAIYNVSDFWNISPCTPYLKVEVQSGGTIDGAGEDYATAFVRVPCPDIMITKYVKGMDSTWYDANTQATGPVMANGSVVSWKYVIENIGDEPLTNVVVTDDQGVTVTCPQNTLNVTETMICFADGTVPDPCESYRNEGRVDGIGVLTGKPVWDTDPAHYVCEPYEVPVLTPIGLMGLIGLLGMIGIFGVKRRD